MPAELLDAVSLDKSCVPGLWLFVRLELGEELVEGTFVLLCQVALEEVRDVEQKVGRDPPCTRCVEHGEFVRVTVNRELGIFEAERWVESGCRKVQFHMGEDKLQGLQEWVDVAILF